MRVFDGVLVLAVLVVVAGTPLAAQTPGPEPSPSATVTSSFVIEPVATPVETPASSSAPSPGPSASPNLPICTTAKITPIDTMDSRNANPGQSFRFGVASVDDPERLHPNVAPSAQGLGLVSVVRRGRSGGEPGLLVLEARYVVAADGSHVPVAMMRSVNGLYMGKTHNSPSMLGLIPYVGYVTGTYDALHKGGDVSAGPADTLIVLVGDDAISGGCTPPLPPKTAAK